jgi:hypothetical protein
VSLLCHERKNRGRERERGREIEKKGGVSVEVGGMREIDGVRVDEEIPEQNRSFLLPRQERRTEEDPEGAGQGRKEMKEKRRRDEGRRGEGYLSAEDACEGYEDATLLPSSSASWWNRP